MKTKYKINDLCNVQSGGTPRRGVDGYYGGIIPWAKIGDIENADNGFITQTQETITEQGLRSINNRLFPKNTVLLAMYGSVGKTAIAGKEISTNQAILGINPKDTNLLDFRFLKYFLDFSKANLVNRARGVALQNISATIVKEFEINLPDIEQQRITINTLDRAGSLRQKRNQAINLLDEYLKSVFLEMFGDTVTNPKGWQIKTLNEMLDFMTSGSRGWARYYSDTGSIFLTIKNVSRAGKLLLDDITYVNAPDNAEAKRTKVRDGDVLLSITADLGRTAVVENLDTDGYINQHLVILRLKEEYNPYFISSYLSSSGGQLQMQKLNKGAAKAGLNFNDIKSIKVLVPPLELQEKYKQVVESVEDLKKRMLEQTYELDNQFNALLQKHFNSN